MRAAVLVPLYEQDGRLRLIMTRRPDTMRSHPGDVVFPGGMIDPGDESHGRRFGFLRATLRFWVAWSPCTLGR
jgi:8-oxo-dGTP pyrophosphatase MutT (NUDIX family)